MIIESYVLYIHLFVGNDNKISISNYLSVKIHISVPIIGTSLRNFICHIVGLSMRPRLMLHVHCYREQKAMK